MKKLGIKEGNSILIANAPGNYMELLGVLPPNVHQALPKEIDLDFIHYFETHLSTFEEKFFQLREQLHSNGMLWISWPKGSSKMSTDLNRDLIREFILESDMVDIKVCSIDETWSGLKFMIRKELR